MITVKSPTFARPPPQRLNIDRCIAEQATSSLDEVYIDIPISIFESSSNSFFSHLVQWQQFRKLSMQSKLAWYLLQTYINELTTARDQSVISMYKYGVLPTPAKQYKLNWPIQKPNPTQIRLRLPRRRRQQLTFSERLFAVSYPTIVQVLHSKEKLQKPGEQPPLLCVRSLNFPLAARFLKFY